MKILRFFCLFIVISFIPIFNAFSIENPFFGDKNNQFGFNLGQAFESYDLLFLPEDPVPFNIIQIQYSQPHTFFRLPARQSIIIAHTIGYGKKHDSNNVEWNWTKYSIPMISFAWDFAIPVTSKLYVGSGLNIGVQSQENERMGTKLLSGFKFLLGFKIADDWRMEILMHHYSNGSTAKENYSYNFYELGLNYSF